VIKVEPVVRSLFTYVGVRGIERYGYDVGAVGQYDHRTVKMHFEPLERVVRFNALGPFKVQVPVHLAFGASHYRACVDHVPILAARATSTGPFGVCGPMAEESPASRSFPHTDPLRATRTPLKETWMVAEDDRQEGATGVSGPVAEVAAT
jgi:hypothetical protein